MHLSPSALRVAKGLTPAQSKSRIKKRGGIKGVLRVREHVTSAHNSIPWRGRPSGQKGALHYYTGNAGGAQPPSEG